MGDSPATTLAFIGVTSILGLLAVMWYLWALSRLFPHLGLPAWQGWIPFLNQWQLLERARLPGWLILLGVVSFGVVPLIALVIAAHRLNREVNAGGALTVLALFIPPLWAMLLAARFDAAGGDVSTNLLARVEGLSSETATPRQAQPAPGPTGDSAWAPPPGHVSGPPPPPAWNLAPSPPGFSAPPVAPPPVHPAAQLPPPSAASRVDPFLPPPPPAPAPPRPAPALPPADADDHTIVSEPADLDDHTVVVARETSVQWVLEIDGQEYSLDADTVVGRAPAPIAGAVALAIDDASRVLSKSHARFRQTDEGWVVQDLGSTNGTALIHDDGRYEELRAHDEVPATEYLELGTLPAQLRMR